MAFEAVASFLNSYPIFWPVYGFVIFIPLVALVSYFFWPKVCMHVYVCIMCHFLAFFLLKCVCVAPSGRHGVLWAEDASFLSYVILVPPGTYYGKDPVPCIVYCSLCCVFA